MVISTIEFILREISSAVVGRRGESIFLFFLFSDSVDYEGFLRSISGVIINLSGGRSIRCQVSEISQGSGRSWAEFALLVPNLAEVDFENIPGSVRGVVLSMENGRSFTFGPPKAPPLRVVSHSERGERE